MTKPRLIDQVRNVLRVHHYSVRTEENYIQWIRRFIFFHNKRHPREMGEKEIRAFLTHLAVDKHVSASTQNQALSALLFLYKKVLQVDLEWIDDVVRAKRPKRLSVVLTKTEVNSLLSAMTGTSSIVVRLLYGTGMRLMEAVRLRIQDVDFEQNQIVVRSGKGDKDRITMLPASMADELVRHIRKIRDRHNNDLEEGFGSVYLPFALDEKYF